MLKYEQLQNLLTKTFDKKNTNNTSLTQNLNHFQISPNNQNLFYLTRNKDQQGNYKHTLHIISVFDQSVKSINIIFLDNQDQTISKIEAPFNFIINPMDEGQIVFYNENHLFLALYNIDAKLKSSKNLYAQKVMLPQVEEKMKWKDQDDQLQIVNVSYNSRIKPGILCVWLSNGTYYIYNFPQPDCIYFEQQDNITDVCFGTSTQEIYEPQMLFFIDKYKNIWQKYIPQLLETNEEFKQDILKLNHQYIPSCQINQSNTQQVVQIVNQDIVSKIDNNSAKKIIKLPEFQNLHIFFLFYSSHIEVLCTNMDIIPTEHTNTFVIDMLIFNQNESNPENIPKFLGKIKHTYYFYHNNKIFKADFSWLNTIEKTLEDPEANIEALFDKDKQKSDFTIIFEFNEQNNTVYPDMYPLEIQDIALVRDILIVLDKQNQLFSYNMKLTQNFLSSQNQFFTISQEIQSIDHEIQKMKQDKKQETQELKQRLDDQQQNTLKEIEIEWDSLSDTQKNNIEELKKVMDQKRQKMVDSIKQQLELTREKYYSFKQKQKDIQSKVQDNLEYIQDIYQTKYSKTQENQKKLNKVTNEIHQKLTSLLKDEKIENGNSLRSLRLKQLTDLKSKLINIKEKLQNTKEKQQNLFQIKQDLKNEIQNNPESLNYNLSKQDKEKFQTLIKNSIDTIQHLDNKYLELKNNQNSNNQNNNILLSNDSSNSNINNNNIFN